MPELYDSAPISLYFDVPHNEAVDLAVIARASMAWASLIKELASVTDPGLEITVDFLSGTVGSRSINSVIEVVFKVAREHPWTSGSLSAVAGVFLLAPVNHLATDVTNDLAKSWFGHEDSVLSDGDVDRVAKKVDELQRNRVAVALKNEVFIAAGMDERVKGIGVGPKIGRPPETLIVSRNRFNEHSGSVPIMLEEASETRTSYRDAVPVTIIRPYSKAEERRWRFEDRRGEFSATMRDPIFLEALRTRHTGIELGEGVQMRVNLRIREERIGNVWHEREYDVLKVVEPNVDQQTSLQFAPNKPNKANAKNNE